MSKRLRASARHITEATGRNSNEKIVGAGGEINAGSKRELMHKILEISQMISGGEMYTDVSHMNTPDTSNAALEDANAILEEAYHGDPHAEWAELGSGLAAELDERLMRDGFMRTIFSRGEVAENSIVRIRVRTPNVRGVVSRGVGTVYPQFVRDKYILADEFQISANPRVEELDMHQGSSDILEDKFYESQEQIMIGEDRTVHALMKASVGIYNAPIYFTGAFSPVVFQGLRQSVTDWNLPAQNLVFANDILSDMIVGNDFTTWFDPVTQYDILQTGRVGSLLGMNMITDGYREPTLQVLQKGEVFCTASPNYTGAYTDRGPVRSEPVTSYPDGIAARGWYVYEHISATLSNAKAVAMATKQ